MREVIATSQAPAAVGPYSQAIKHNGVIYVSGQLPFDPQTGEECKGSIADKTTLIMNNLQAIAKEAGSDLSRALKITIFLTDLGNFGTVNEAYAKFFDKEPPARCCFEVSGLPKGCEIEIDAIIAV
ncbi:MAG TPA: RidA family protein [Clostridiaceae bacterium]|nr:RidA family protein [Clostridiaceae bacterium]